MEARDGFDPEPIANIQVQRQTSTGGIYETVATLDGQQTDLHETFEGVTSSNNLVRVVYNANRDQEVEPFYSSSFTHTWPSSD
ncbi:hypothetical protein HUG15_19975 [Salicibibacter cibarius]|uniref:Uncharacterized protein n=1 Tax=Salicibibacter cibarius TaxID=2743000 RepID=A0A7T6Z611_9BACI|nr:hypothetical protein [Salicibibacter cibarius]QQK77638.1 hypothetical protein HUG15_19975 [Salicibibacter cibarius]